MYWVTGLFGEGERVSNDINILALAKGEERYIFLYNDQTRSETLRMLGRYASNSELSFSWYDAAVMSQKIRKTVRDAEVTEELFPVASRFEVSPLKDLLSGEEPIS
jgi:hypothetical protein